MELKSVDKRGNSPLHEAADWGSLKCIKVLIEAGADVNAVNKRGDTPLHTAVRQPDLPCTKALLEAGAHVNAINKVGSTALDLAQQPSYDFDLHAEELDKLLVEYGGLSSYNVSKQSAEN